MFKHKNARPYGFLIMFLLIALSAFPQESNLAGTFKLSGNLSGYRTSAAKLMVTLLKPTGGYIFDSVAVKNNSFEYSYELKEPMLLLFSVKGNNGETGGQRSGNRGVFDYMTLYAVPSTNVVKLKDSLLLTAIPEGGTANVSKAYNKLYDNFNKIGQQANAIIAERKITDRAKMTGIRDSLTAIADETVLKPFIIANPKSVVSVRALLDYASRPVWQPRKNMDPELISKMLAPMPVAFKQLPAMALLGQSLETAKKTMRGKPAMDFALKDTLGNTVRLSDFKGKTVFIDFWASWCVPCRKENPNVLKLYQQYKDKGLVVLSVSLDNADKRADWLKAIRDDAIGAFVHVSELKGFASQPAVLYDVKAIPTNFIIDAEGRFVARNVYGEALAAKFAEIFNKQGK